MQMYKYMLSFVNFIFTDINECDEQTSGCEQVCINIAGSYTCACNAGYSLHTDGLSCNDGVY